MFDGYIGEDNYRKNLINTLINTKYEDLKNVCSKLSYAFSPYDFIRLANGYKNGNKELKSKIEYILDDCNFRDVSSLLSNGKVDELIETSKNEIEEQIIKEVKQVFIDDYLKDNDSFIPANSNILDNFTLNELFFCESRNVIQRRKCEGLAFELSDKEKNKLFDLSRNFYSECDNKTLCDIDLRKLKSYFEDGDSIMLYYLKDFIDDKNQEMFYKVMDYNEIYANGWNISTLYEMGKSDSYWTERADSFIKKYNLRPSEYEKDLLDKYFELRDDLLCNLGLDTYLLNEDIVFDKDGIISEEIITSINELNYEKNYTVARVKNFNHCIELHCNKGKTYLEFGERISFDCWENEIKNVDMFDLDMNDLDMMKKLNELFSEYKENNYSTSFLENNEKRRSDCIEI